MEVLDMIEKLLKIILPDKIENRKAEVHKQALDLNPGYSDFVDRWCMPEVGLDCGRVGFMGWVERLNAQGK